MKKKLKMIMFLLMLVILLQGCSFNKKHIHEDNSSDIKEKENKKDYSNRDIIKDRIDGMTLDEKIGQLFIIGIYGTTLDDKTKEIIDKYNIGGIILFSRNIESSSQLKELINEIKEYNRDNIPLFISIDEEGGRVSRLPNNIENFPSNKVIGEKDDEKLAYKIGEIQAEKLKYFGINMNYAPVLDIYSNKNNTVIGDRSYGDDANVVTKLGIATMEGMKDNRIISVIKHFPGHGDTEIDSHIGLPKVNKSLKEIGKFELIPFRKAIINDVDAIMVAHILMNKIDNKYPASMSEKIINDLLRKQLNFKGLVITDDMTMGAIKRNYSIDNAAIKAIKSGSDIVLVCHEYSNEIKAIEGIKTAIQKGEISEERIEKSLYRIIKIKQKYNLNDKYEDKISIDNINEKVINIIN